MRDVMRGVNEEKKKKKKYFKYVLVQDYRLYLNKISEIYLNFFLGVVVVLYL